MGKEMLEDIPNRNRGIRSLVEKGFSVTEIHTMTGYCRSSIYAAKRNEDSSRYINAVRNRDVKILRSKGVCISVICKKFNISRETFFDIMPTKRSQKFKASEAT